MVKDYDLAIRDLKAAEALDRHNPEIIYNLGVSYCRLGLYKTAVGYLQRVLDLPQAFVEELSVKKMLAYSLIHTGETGLALEYLDQVLTVSRTDCAALSMKGYCLEKQGMLEDAIRVYRDILVIDRDCINAKNSIAYLLAQEGGDLEEALEYALEANRSDPDNPAYCDTLGYVYLLSGDTGSAKKYLEKAMAMSPFSEDVRDHVRMLSQIIK